MEIIELKKMLLEESKHAGYQILSKRLSEIISDNEIKVKSRYEFERLAYILKNIDVNNKKVLDIGGNTGFFTFELLDNGAEKVHYYDGNITHARFVDGASKILNLENKIQITNTYYTFENRTDERYDLALLLNVLHHIGDDYGDKKISINKAKKDIIKQLNFLAEVAKIIVFQLGFNWKGNRKLNLLKMVQKEKWLILFKKVLKTIGKYLKSVLQNVEITQSDIMI